MDADTDGKCAGLASTPSRAAGLLPPALPTELVVDDLDGLKAQYSRDSAFASVISALRIFRAIRPRHFYPADPIPMRCNGLSPHSAGVTSEEVVIGMPCADGGDVEAGAVDRCRAQRERRSDGD